MRVRTKRGLGIALALFFASRLAFAFSLEIVEGWTGALEFQLKADGTVVDLTGTTVELLLYKADGTLVDTTSDITLTTPASGIVTYDPDATDLLASETPHRSRFKVTDGSGKIVYFPNGAMDKWLVRSP